MDPIRIVVVDDHPLIQHAVQQILDTHPNISIVGKGFNGSDVYRLLDEHQPDVILLDINMPLSADSGTNFHIIPAISKITQNYPNTNIIILTSENNITVINQTLARGAKGYVLKNDNLSMYLDAAIRMVYEGGVFLSESVEKQKNSTTRLQPCTTPKLTERQTDVLNCLVQTPDAPYSEISQQLNMSIHTVKFHIKHLKRQLKANNRASLIIRAAQSGLIEIM